MTELRADMIQQAQDQVKHTSDESEQQINVQKIIDKHTKEFVVSIMILDKRFIISSIF